MSQPASLPVWVVNLARSVERRAYITTHLNALGLPFEIVPAVEGKALTAGELTEAYDPLRTIATIGREMAAGEIGCALSHFRLYQRMVDADIDVALIVEDDAVIHPDTLDLLAKQENFPDDWEILLLNHTPTIGGRINRWHRTPVASRQIGRFSRPAYGTGGYLIRQSAARALLKQAYPIHCPADHWTGGSIKTGIRIYGVEPPCIEQLPADVLCDNTISDRELYWKLWGMPELPSGLGLYLYCLKVWLIKTYCQYHPGKII